YITRTGSEQVLQKQVPEQGSTQIAYTSLDKRLFSLFSALPTASKSSPEASLPSNPAGIADNKFRYSHPNSPPRYTSAVRSSSERSIRLPSAQSAVSPAYPLT